MDPTFLSAVQLAALVRGGKIGALELLDHFIGRAERLDSRINAIVVRDFDRARQRARALDNQADKSAPLFGVPATVKESFDVAGLPTTRGHAALKDATVRVSTLPVRRLEAAGAVIFGKTNVPVDLADWQSYNPVYGVTSNPWSTAHTPGGSSGGSAAALAAGLTGFEMGTDIGGSIRVPAHFCGVFGHKPSWGLLPNYGDPATSSAAGTDIACLGPMSRSAADLQAGLEILAGPDPDETALTLNLPAPRATALKGLRAAVWADQAGIAADPETTAAMLALADALEREGAIVSRSARPALDPLDAYHLYLKLLDAAWSGRLTEETLASRRRDLARLKDSDQSADAVMLRMTDVPHRLWLGLNEQRFRLRRAWTAFFREWDVLLCPAFATAALPHRQDGNTWERRITVGGREIAYNDLLFWPGLTGGYHLPATVAPIAATQAGLPLGVQIAGPIHGDRTTIGAAALIEQALGGFKPPPGW
ncbi:amidase [Rhodopila sp.]|jgi:amidase|uniref:amidase n=1 Tax=Rhodopila sp. TaxID=2480087 RepID=UPI002BA08611|nr:amidase [Rhodopila sp.]HVZ07062.1 amidase [Rhodopila sp.]